jgi:hypothetical protein
MRQAAAVSYPQSRPGPQRPEDRGKRDAGNYGDGTTEEHFQH